MKNYTINYTDNGITITITKSFAKEAGIYNSEAYNILKGLRADFPGCKVELKKIKRNPEKKTYGKLTYERMKEYILFVEGKDTATLKEFETVKTLATFKACLLYTSIISSKTVASGFKPFKDTIPAAIILSRCSLYVSSPQLLKLTFIGVRERSTFIFS